MERLPSLFAGGPVGRPFIRGLATGLVAGWIAVVSAGCGSAPDHGGSLSSMTADPSGGPPPLGHYECTFRFVRLEGDLPAYSLGSRYIQETSDRQYGERPVSHGSGTCEVTREPGGPKYLLVPGQPRIRIQPLSGSAFVLEWDDRAEFHRLDRGAFQGEVRTMTGVETVTLYPMNDAMNDPMNDPMTDGAADEADPARAP